MDLSSASFRSILCIGLVLKLKIEKLHTCGHAQNDRKLLKSPKTGIFTIFINFGVPLYIKYENAKIYGDPMAILYAHATSAQSLNVRKVIILLVRDFEQILLSHDS